MPLLSVMDGLADWELFVEIEREGGVGIFGVFSHGAQMGIEINKDVGVVVEDV